MAATTRLLPVVILAPKGRLGLEICPPNEKTSNYVWVTSVDPSGPLFGRVRPGDVIARINNNATQFKTVNEVSNMFAETTDSPSRFVTFLRPTPDSSATQGKEHAVNHQEPSTTSSAGSAAKKAPPAASASAPKKPPPSAITPLVLSKPPPPKPTPTSTANNNGMPPVPLVNSTPQPMMMPPAMMPQMMMAPYTPMIANHPPLQNVKPPPASKRKANVVTASKPKKKKVVKDVAERTWDLLEDIPEPGFVCSKAIFYSTLNNETLAKVADKLGTDWKTMAALPENTSRYGQLRASSIFKAQTLLYIPKNRSKWRMKQLSKTEQVESEECTKCGIASNPAEMLLCDGCDSPYHVACVGLTCVPEGDWFCPDCLQVLKARASHSGEETIFKLPPLPALRLGPEHEFAVMQQKLRSHLQNRRVEALSNLDSYNKATRASFQSREQELQAEIIRIKRDIELSEDDYNRHLRTVMAKHGLAGWNLGNWNKSNNWIQVRQGDRVIKLIESEHIVGRLPLYHWQRAMMTSAWDRAMEKRQAVNRNAALKKKDKRTKTLQTKLRTTKESLDECQGDVKNLSSTETEEHRRIQAEYAALLNEPQLKEETNAAYKRREYSPRYLGMVHLADEVDVLAINMLSEPDELVIAVPTGDKDFTPRVGGTYSVFARAALFDKKRDDELPMEKNGVRDAQRRLFQLLSSYDANKAMVVTRPSIPPTVKIRSDDENATRCFDLSELVRDCNVDLDLPKEPTPASMAENGLELRDYQQSSLRWMLDKEKETTGLGLAGELWHRLRFQDPRASEQYFYCELTGSFALEIFDYRSDAEQRDASMNRFAMPTGGVLGEEMGLGKTVISIALIIQNPPPLEHRVLPREHIWPLEKKTVIDHPEYLPPPNVGSTSRLSNGTLIVVPMTLLSQWQQELERFAPHLRVLILHNSENPNPRTVASSDVVIASTFLLQKSHKPGTKSAKGNVNLLALLKRIHWHRLIVDEAHYNQQGEKTKLALASLSATHRASVTGTPIGSQLSDLQGQLRFLRVAPFDRPAFWKNNVEDPFYDHNPESLKVLRSLLSRVVVRHSKEQTFGDGKSLLCLPPRSVETVLLKFGSETEKQVYESIEARNQTYFMKLKRESMKTVASKYLALNGLLTSARQACGHVSLVSPEKLHNFNRLSSDKDVKTQAVVAKKTRKGILESALDKARHSAKLRMRVVINQFQSSELLECPVCLECAGEEEIAIPACAHPLCSHCIMSILDGATGTRDATGHCPTCRDIMRRSEITFLGDATDAGTKSKNDNQAMDVDEDSKMPAVASVNGFQVTSSNVHVCVTGASTLRAGRNAMTDSQLRGALHSDRAYLSTLKEGFLRSYYDAEAKVGTKISELLQEINAMTRRDPKSKCVVFSQFLGVLDVASEELQARGIGFVRLDGSLKQHERADALLEFSSNPKTKVFLLSMRSGAVGLTLTPADHCFIMDIAQNSAIEEQAIDRIHRIGQTRPVTVKRFVMQDTVEERLLGVRRSLNADRPSAGTQICGASVLAGEEKVAEKAAKMKVRYTGNVATEELDAKKQMRVEMLEKLFGCSGGIHKA